MSLENILVFSLACLATLIVCPWTADVSRSIGAVEPPSPGREGGAIGRALPRCGGLAIFAGFHLAALFLFSFPHLAVSGIVDSSWWIAFGAASFTLLVVGTMDDVYVLSRSARIAGQSIAATFAFAAGLDAGKLLGLAMPVSGGYVLTVVFLLVVMNAIRSFDGIDGVAPGAAAIAAVGLASTFAARGLRTEALLAVGLAGACAGFLVRGLVPARVTLGSAGGMLLGFTLGCFVLIPAGEGGPLLTAAIPLLILALPLADSALALWRRATRVLLSRLLDQPAPAAQRDFEHIPHRLVEAGSSPREACLAIFLFCAFLASSGAVAAFWPALASASACLMVISIVAVGLRAAADVEIRGTSLAAVHLLGRQTKPGATRAAFFLLAIAGLALSHLCASLVAGMGSERAPSMVPLLLCSVLPALSWLQSGIGNGRSSIVSPLQHVFCVLGASAVGFWLSVVGGAPLLEATIEYLVYSGLACGAMHALGLLPQAIEICMLYGDAATDRANVLLCGSPPLLRKFVDEAAERAIVIGIVSGSPIETALSATGEPAVLGEVAVLGEIKDIPRLITTHCVHRIVVAGEMALEAKQEIQRLASMHSVPVSEWNGGREPGRAGEVRI